MTNKEALDFLQGLKKVANFEGHPFAYRVARNIDHLVSIAKALGKAVEPSEALRKLQDERMKLVKKYGKKDTSGAIMPKIDARGVSYPIDPKHTEAFDTETKVLNECDDHKEASEEETRKNKQYDKSLEAKVEDFKLMKVTEAELPSNITANQVLGIMPMIQE